MEKGITNELKEYLSFLLSSQLFSVLFSGKVLALERSSKGVLVLEYKSGLTNILGVVIRFQLSLIYLFLRIVLKV